MLKPQEGVAMATRSGLVDGVRSSLCLQSLLGFFFNKGVRGGPRVLLNLAGVLVALIIFVKLLPQRMTESALQSIPIPQSIWSSLGAQNDNNVPGGLRIVVFGEIDIGTPVGADDEVEDVKTWTQALCDQLACDNHISMVPSPDAASWSLSSNDLYAHGVEQVLNDTGDRDGPGQDYSYLSTAYPPQWKSSDLKHQVDKFLAMPKPHATPGSTLWVFSFGLWDVWSLSALPMSTGREAVEAMTKDMFEQIERLYAASMDHKSIAYSDINSFIQNSVRETTGNKEEAPAEGQPGAGDETVAHSQPATGGGKTTSVDSFQILIPRIIDPSMLPGWRDLRPQIPAVHSKAEQMRNAAALTSAWNDGVVSGLADWVTKDDPKEDQDGRRRRKNKKEEASRFDTVAPGARARPTRDGFAYGLADLVLDRMLERQLRSAHLADGHGRGGGRLEDGYRDVRSPCLQPVGAAAVSVATQSDVTLRIPNVRTGNDKQVPSRPAAPPSAAVRRRDEADRKEGLAYLSTARVCEIPGDHLFYTPFALSQRAIQEVAAETAEMIRKGESVRAKLDA